MSDNRARQWSLHVPHLAALTRISARERVLVLVVLLAAALDISGALHVYGIGWLMGQRQALVSALVYVALAGAWLRYGAIGDTGEQPLLASITIRRVIALLMTAAWCATSYDGVCLLSQAPRWSLVPFFALGLLLFVVACVRAWSNIALASLAALFGSLARLLNFAALPITPNNGDMLPLVQSALDNLLAGRSPYMTYKMPWDVPLTYLPATWLAYLPSYLLGFDIRVTNLVAELAISASLFWLASQWHEQPSNVALALWGWVFIQPSSLHWSLATTAPIFWTLLAATLALSVAKRTRLAALMLGLCAAASPLVAVVAPLVALHWLRSYGWRRTLLLGTLALLVAGAIIAPFLIWSPHEFVFGAWRWFNDNDLYPRLRWEMDNTWAVMPGFSGIFWRRGLVFLLKPIQLLLVAAVVLSFGRKGATAREIAPAVVAAYLLFTVFNPVLWPYLYTPALIAAMIAAVVVEAHEQAD